MRKIIFLLPVLLFLLNFILKILHLSSMDIAHDEPFSIFHAQQNVSEIWAYFTTAAENNPPLYHLILHCWIKLFGISAFSVRFPSLLFSSAIAVIIYLSGKKYFTVKTGLLASLLFSFSTAHLYYSHESRTYPLFCLLTIVSLYASLGVIKSPGKKNNYILLIVANTLLIYSHYFGFFVLLVELISFLVCRQRKHVLKGACISFMAIALCYLPLVFTLFNRFTDSVSKGTWVQAPAKSELYGYINIFINNRYNTLVYLLVVFIAFVLLWRTKKIAGFIKRYLKAEPNQVLLIWFLVSYLSMFLVSCIGVPMFIERYILYISIPLYFMLASILVSAYQGIKYKYLAIGVFIISMFLTLRLNPDNHRKLKEACEKMKQLKTGSTPVIISPDYADAGFAYHYDLSIFKDYTNFHERLQKENIYFYNTAEAAEKLISQTKEKLIFIQAGNEFVDPDNNLLKSIYSHYSHHEEYHVYQIYNIHCFYN